MKRSDFILKRGDLRGYSFSGFLPLLKAVSLGTVMTALLLSVSLVIASTFSPTEQQTTIQRQKDLNSSKSTDGSGVLSSNILREGSEGRNRSVHFSSNQFCGVDDIVVSNTFDSKQIDTGRTITEGNYEALIASRKFASCQLERAAIWTVDGRNSMSDMSNFMPSYALKSDHRKEGQAEGQLLWGSETQGRGASAIAIGNRAAVNGAGAIAMGGYVKTTMQGVVSYIITEARGERAIAIGTTAMASNLDAVAIGYSAKTTKNAGLALGAFSEVIVDTGIALGSHSLADVAGGVAGYDPITGKATTDKDMAWVSNSSAVSIGKRNSAGVETSRQIINLAAGTEDTDAVNVAQLKALRKWAGDEIAKAGGDWNLSVNGKDSTNVSSGSTVDFSSTGNLEISKDQDNKVTFDLAKSITVDKLTVAGHTLDQTGLTLKGGPSVTAANGIDAGRMKIQRVADGFLDDDAVNKKQLNVVEELVKKGWRLSVNGGEDLYIGADYQVGFLAEDQNLSILWGDSGNIKFGLAQDISVNSVILGRQILNKDGLTLADGTSITTNGIAAGGKKISGVLAGTEDTDAVNFSQLNAVKNELEKNNWIQQDSATGIITIGAQVGGTAIDFANKDGEGRILSGLKDGAVSKTSNEAVTGKQLYEVESKVTETSGKVEGLSTGMTAVQGDVSKIAKNTSEYLGGGANILDGRAPTYRVQGKDYQNVGTAFTGVDGSITDIYSKIAGVAGDSLLEQEASEDGSGRITIGAKVGGTEINLANKGDEGRILSGLKDGAVSETSNEAITGSQLYETNTKLAEYFGGGAKYGANGWTAPKFEVVQLNSGSKSGQKNYNKYDTVADAFDAVNKSMESLNNRIDGVENQADQNGLQWNESKGAYDARRKDSDSSRITGVKDGTISEGSSDVVTGNQLWETNSRVKELEDKIDGFEGSVGVEGAVQYDKGEDGKKTNKITLAGGDASAPVVIDNVGDGKVEKGSKEAINGGQLYEKMTIVLDDAKKYTDEKIKSAVSEAKEYTDMKFDSLNYNIEGVKQEARQAAAVGIAVANLRYNEAPGKISIAFSSGSWRSQSAIAFGAGYTSESGNIRSNLSITTAGGHWGIGAGIQLTLN
ncbi:YadA-like family protein [Bartonella sp. AR 15-3]|uniref:YadA-like family protein n=1 Tax=Bartonella sp. AR 15-3 TaxID=545617 RepID=UPI0001F4CDB5|nr:YadA-like family protein [Bartonella sp. AR 15-3]OPB31194.1 Autotransporter adhesin [Bartonella sp. AR 15-3]CBI79776.1 exported hypothetical protein [Bartonella sp. AR 15-3]